MTTFPGSPKLLKGGLVLLDPDTAALRRVIVLQYNSDALTRSFQVQAAGEGGDRAEALRLKGPPVETIKLDAELDATDQLEFGEPATIDFGLHPQIAALESVVYPDSGLLVRNNQLAAQGTLEIVPAQSSLTLFVWSKHRIVPVRLTDLSVTEEAFDPQLNPIRARVSLGLRVLSVDDLGFNHAGGSLFMAYHQQKERLAALVRPGALNQLGLGGLP
jgi:hypothetical protein